MVGNSREQVLACIGTTCQQGGGGGYRGVVVCVRPWMDDFLRERLCPNRQLVLGCRNQISGIGTATATGMARATSSRRYCTVNIAMADGQVWRVN
jgi:hypothetical protein